MPRKKETTVDVAAETKAVEAKPNASKATKTTKTSKSESPSLPSKTTVAAKAITPIPKPKKQAQPKPKTITRTELIQEVARAINEHMEITHRDAEEIVSEIINSMIKALKEGEEIEIRGFGAFRVRTRNARNGRNPKNGAPVEVPSKNVVFFKQGKDLKQTLLNLVV
ncbi:MAG: HU family DNA-binding protein [Blastocatellia bacterium]